MEPWQIDNVSSLWGWLNRYLQYVRQGDRIPLPYPHVVEFNNPKSSNGITFSILLYFISNVIFF